MDQINIDYSLKNIPIPSKFQYKKQLVSKVASFASRLRWKAFFILNPTEGRQMETFGFRSLKKTPPVPELKQFEDELFRLVTDIKFKQFKNTFQDKLRADKEEILRSKEVLVKADKSTNIYKVNPDEYNKLLIDNITKDYRKCPRRDVDKVTREAASIARSYELDDRIDAPTEDEAFITIKDHKESFPGKVECRLINPAKNHIGAISKAILDRVNANLRAHTKSNQWQSTQAAINWFKKIKTSNKKTFLKFDIVSFYPSISKELLTKTIKWAASITHVTNEEVDIIMHCRKTFLFHKDECWVKKTDSCFDVSMGGLDSAEVCELVGLFLLFNIEQLIPQEDVGLYRDDGLAVVELPGPEIERLRKQIVQIFTNHGLKITTQVNITTTDFLDVLLDLRTGLHRPFRKTNSNLLYVHKDSNHSTHVKKELPSMIERRLSNLSSNKEIFMAESGAYNNALAAAGYSDKLQYNAQESRKTRTRSRKVTWFNPPWNDEVSTNVAKRFLGMIDRHFQKGSALGRHINRNTVKVSYSSMTNMEKIISGQNKKVANMSSRAKIGGCNCRKPPCPLDGQCQTTNLVYKSTITTADNTKMYIGLTGNSFKERFTGHKASFTHRTQAHKTTLSSHIWELKDKDIPFTQQWDIICTAPSYNRKVRTCHLCIMEKTHISMADPTLTLNKRNEIIAKCRHRDKVLLKNW